MLFIIPELGLGTHEYLLSSRFAVVMTHRCRLGAVSTVRRDRTLEEEGARRSSALLTWLKESFDKTLEHTWRRLQQRFAMLLNFLEQIVLGRRHHPRPGRFFGTSVRRPGAYTASSHLVFWFLLGARCSGPTPPDSFLNP